MISSDKRLTHGACGFTLLEVLVAVGIFSVASAAIATCFASQLKFNYKYETKSGAIAAAQQVLDGIRVLDPTTLPSSGSATPQTVTIGGKNFVVNVTYCSPSTYCVSNNIRALHVVVTYANVTQYTVDTIFSQLR